MISLVGSDVMEAILKEIETCPAGPIAEVGVYQGGSAMWLARSGRTLHLYDTFTGIPEATEGLDGHKIGDFGDNDLNAVRQRLPGAHFHVGVFPSTFVPMKYAFVHVDCDQYQSVKACINTFLPWMIPGGKMWFDDYACLPGATKAIEECGIPFRSVHCGKAMMVF